MLQGARNRTAMTLVELVVVMTIIITFTAITAAFYPANQADRELSRFSSTVQSALLSARNRAKAERLPTGIRFYDSDANGKVDSVVLIQKPAPLDGLIVGNVTVNPMTSVLGFPATYQGVINPGDFMLLESGDVATIATAIPNATVTNASSGFIQNLSAYGTKYKIFRGAIDLPGDTPFELSNIIEIQIPSTLRFSLPSSFTQASYFPPQLPAPAAANPPLYFEIIFNPDGSLNNFTSEVYLHLHNFESLAGDYSRDAIIAVRKMSGSIGVYEVGPTGAPYQFAFDPRNKGI
jgi:type II secretory pathway pseudopilin PulG